MSLFKRKSKGSQGHNVIGHFLKKLSKRNSTSVHPASAPRTLPEFSFPAAAEILSLDRVSKSEPTTPNYTTGDQPFFTPDLSISAPITPPIPSPITIPTVSFGAGSSGDKLHRSVIELTSPTDAIRRPRIAQDGDSSPRSATPTYHHSSDSTVTLKPPRPKSQIRSDSNQFPERLQSINDYLCDLFVEGDKEALDGESEDYCSMSSSGPNSPQILSNLPRIRFERRSSAETTKTTDSSNRGKRNRNRSLAFDDVLLPTMHQPNEPSKHKLLRNRIPKHSRTRSLPAVLIPHKNFKSESVPSQLIQWLGGGKEFIHPKSHQILSVPGARCLSSDVIKAFSSTHPSCEIEFLDSPELYPLQSKYTFLPFPTNHFDCITARSLSFNVQTPDWKKVLSEFHRVLKPGGTIEILLFDADWLNPCAASRKYSSEVREWLSDKNYHANPSRIVPDVMTEMFLGGVEIFQIALPVGWGGRLGTVWEFYGKPFFANHLIESNNWLGDGWENTKVEMTNCRSARGLFIICGIK